MWVERIVRQQDMFTGAGWAPSLSTINELLNQSGELLQPLIEQLSLLVRSDMIVLGDDTRVKQDQANNGCINSYAWLYTGLDDFAHYNVFYWSISRAQDMVHSHLSDFKGTLVGDAFGGNSEIATKSNDSIVFAGCSAHARRKFVEAEPVWQRFRKWLDGIPPDQRLPKSKLGKAVTYTKNQWDALRVYLTNGRLPIGNLQSERMIRPLTIGRKNWMFLGHPIEWVWRSGKPVADV